MSMTSRPAVALILTLALTACEGAFKPTDPGPEPDPGRMTISISGALTYQATWSGSGELRDMLGADTYDFSLLRGQAIDGPAAVVLTVVFPGRMAEGTFEMGRYVFGVFPATPAAFLETDTDVFTSIPGGSLTITRADYPVRPGLEPGLMHGSMTFRAVRLGAASADTITITARFNAHWYHYLSSNVAVTLSGGGPVLGTSVGSFGQSVDDDHGGRFLEWEADLDGAPGQGFRYEISQELRLAPPAVGTFTLGNLTPRTYAKPAEWPSAFTALYYRDDSRIGLSAGGTLTVTRYVAPTDEFYGEIHGTLSAPLALWFDSTTVTADTVQVNATFAVQLYPLGGIPASTMERAGIAAPTAPAAHSARPAPARGSARRKA
jgi:hypothetical protein